MKECKGAKAYIKILFMSLCLIIGASTHSYAQDITTGLIAYWKLDETSGTAASDSAGSNNGSYQGGLDPATDSVQGINGTALDFDGVDDFVEFSSATTDGLAVISVSLWLKTTESGTSPTHYTSRPSFAGNESPSGGSNDFILQTEGGNIAYYHGLGSGDQVFVATNTLVNNDQWHHVVFTYDASETNLYLNGAFVPGSTLAADGSLLDDSSFVIGAWDDNGDKPHSGSIDDVRIYNRVLSTADITELYRSREGNMVYNSDARAPEFFDGTSWQSIGQIKPTNSGLVGHWKLDETSGAFIDSSGLGNDGTQSGGVEYASTGVIGSAAGFDGANDYIDLGDIYNGGSWDDFSISAWINANQFGPGDQNTIVSLNADPDIIRFEVDGEPQNCLLNHLRITTGDSLGGYRHACGNTALELNTWHHVAVTYTDNNFEWAIYRNGNEETSGNFPGTIDKPNGNTDPTTIGARTWLFDQNFSGRIDDVRIFNRELSANEINDLYLAGKVVIGDGLVAWYRLDETSGLIAEDLSGNGNDGALQNGVDAGVDSKSGILGRALDFENSGSQRITASGFPTGASQNFSMMAWVNLRSAAPIGDGQGIVSGGTSLSGQGPHMIIPPSASNIRFAIWAGTNLNHGTPITGEWAHYAGTFDGTSIRLYENAILVNGPSAASYSGTVDTIKIGQAYGGITQAVDGLIDDVRIYDRELSQPEIQSLYDAAMCSSPSRQIGTIVYNADHDVMQYCDGAGWQAMGPSPGTGGSGCSNPSKSAGSLVYNRDLGLMQYCDGAQWVQLGGQDQLEIGLLGWWKLDEASGTFADSSGNGNTGTQIGGIEYASVGVIGSAAGFDGVDDYIDVGEDPMFEVPLPVSVAAWAKLDNFDEDGVIFRANNENGRYNGYWLFFQNSNQKVQFSYGDGGGTDSTSRRTIESSSSLLPGQWYHLVGVIRGETDMDIYIDGVEDSGPYSGTGGALFYDPTPGLKHVIGLDDDGGSPEWFNGAIDDVRVYGRALSASEVQQLYLQGGIDPCNASPSIGTVCLDGTVYAGLTPDGNVPFYTTPADQTNSIAWSTESVNHNPDLRDYDSGSTNQAWAEANLTLANYPAFELCANLTDHGHTDWYLPARNENVVLYTNRVAIGGFSSGRYWSSTEQTDINAMVYDFSSGLHFNRNKVTDTANDVRCVRKD